MKTKPILFSTPMVQAILEGRKRQTRRIVKNNNSAYGAKWNELHFESAVSERIVSEEEYLKVPRQWDDTRHRVFSKIEKGDILWIRETIRVGAWDEEGNMAFDYKASPEIKNTPWCFMGDYYEKEVIKITDELASKGVKPNNQGQYEWEAGASPLNWKPSIFMPKAACRIFLEVTNVRV